MDTHTLISILKLVVDDRARNAVLAKLVPIVVNLLWSDISDILGCYRNYEDDDRGDALDILVNFLSLRKYSGSKLLLRRQGCCADLVQILTRFHSHENRILILKNILKYIHNLNWSNVLQILKCFDLDCRRQKAFHIIIKKVKMQDSIKPHLLPILGVLYDDACKNSILEDVIAYSIAPDLQWADIEPIIGCYKNKMNRLDVLRELIEMVTALKNIGTWPDICQVLDFFTDDFLRLAAFRALANQIQHPIAASLMVILKKFPTDEQKLVVLKFIGNRIGDTSSQIIESILNLFSESAYRREARAVIDPDIF